MPLELKTAAPFVPPTSARRSTNTGFLRARKIGSKDRRFFTEQLALLLETGTPLLGALQMLQEQADNPAMAAVLEGLMDEISAGRSFSQALAKYPAVFSSTFVNLVAASEGGGYLHEVLAQLLAEEERRERLRSTLISALSYPAFLIAFSALVVVFVLVVVFPKFGEMFARIEDQLPPTTVVLMAASDLLRDYWSYILAGGAAAFLALRHWAASESGGASLDRLKLGLPVLRGVFAELYLVQALRVMSLSLTHGVTVVDTLRSCQDVVANRLFRRFLADVERDVLEGGTIAAGFQKVEFVPAIVRQMVATGEASGNLGKVMARVADHYERELGKKLEALAKMAEPVMLLIMGLLVGIIVSSLILPIFKLSKAVT